MNNLLKNSSVSLHYLLIFLFLVLSVARISAKGGQDSFIFAPLEQDLYNNFISLQDETFFYRSSIKGNQEVYEALNQIKGPRDFGFPKWDIIDQFITEDLLPPYKELLDRANRLEDSKQKEFLRSLILFDMSKLFFEFLFLKESSLKYLNLARESSKIALRENPKISEVHLIYGMIQNQYIAVGVSGLLVIHYANESKKSYQKALQLDKDNGYAWLLLGMSYFFSPEIAGGSKEKGLRFVIQSRKTMDRGYYISLSYIWESLMSADMGLLKEANIAIDQAIQIAPDNSWAKSIQLTLDRGYNPMDDIM